jgi:L-seryl-tRNA(Ser) seleniumtransferase
VALKPPDLLNRLPSVSELLEKPPIRKLVDRWNRTAVSGSVRTFLDELRSDLQRRASDLPSVRELAERAARYVVSQQQQSLGVAINATGKLWGPPWTGSPLADPALERVMALGREFASQLRSSGSYRDGDLERMLCNFTGAQAAVALHSYSSALWLTLATLAADREVLISRAEVAAIELGEPLPDLVKAAAACLKEVGTTNRTAGRDYETAVSPRTGALLKLSSEDFRIVGDTTSTELDELVALARDRELFLIDALGGAPLTPPPDSLGWPQRSAQASVAAGASLTLLRGDGLLGGPACGILLGFRESVERVARHPLFAALQLDSLRAAALKATLECYDGASPNLQALPVWQCLTAPIENLRNRAERLAPQLAQLDAIASAVAGETRSPIVGAVSRDGGMPSYGVILTPADGNARGLSDRFSQASMPIIGRVEGEQFVLDLRTVFPRQDRLLVEAIVGPSHEPETA